MKKKMEASMTVEAAFVMPIVLFSVIALILMSFYLHDICTIQNVVDDTLHRTSLQLKHETDNQTGKVKYGQINDRGVFFAISGGFDQEQEKIQTYLNQKLSSGLFLSIITGVHTSVSKSGIQIQVDTDLKIYLPVFSNLLLKRRQFKEEAGLHDPAQTIRMTAVILETGQQIKGMDQLKEIISKWKK